MDDELLTAKSSISLDSTADSVSTADPIDPDPINPEEVLFAWRIMFSHVEVATPLEDVVKMAVQALRDGLRECWTDAHTELFRELVTGLTECSTNDNECLLCAKYPNRNELIINCGLFALCREIFMSEWENEESIQLAFSTLPRLAERSATPGKPASVKTFTHGNGDESAILTAVYFDWPEEVSSARTLPVNLELCYQGAPEDAQQVRRETASALMKDGDWIIRAAAVFMLGHPPTTWTTPPAAAAAFAPIVVSALRDEHERVRAEAARQTQRLIEQFPAALTPEHFQTAISAVLSHIRNQPFLLDILGRLAAAAPEGLMRGEYDAAAGRLKTAQGLAGSQDSLSSIFFEAFIAARTAGDACKDDFIEHFIDYLKRFEPLETDGVENVDDEHECYACYEAPAEVVVKKGCDRIDCGSCACSRAHFCASCTARMILAYPNPHEICCQICRRLICIDDLRVVKASDRASSSSDGSSP